MLITVAMPTHNRPQLLCKALASVAAQTHTEWEVMVVDDGSSPPVLESRLRELLGERCERFVLVRHDQAQGIAAAKNAGVATARGEVVLHLDDDDLLTPTALAQIAAVYARHPELECLFINVEPFGTYAPGTAANQSHALSRLRERAQSMEDNGVIFFNSELFTALLKSVPMAMQRPAARKTLWDKVGLLRKGSYMPEPEWANKQPRPKGRGIVTNCSKIIDFHYNIIYASQAVGNLPAEIKHSLAEVYFDQAYHHQHCWQ